MEIIQKLVRILFPITRIQYSEWWDLWKQHDRDRIRAVSQITFLIIGTLYIAHIYLDYSLGPKSPATWLCYRVSFACFSFGLCLLVRKKKLFYKNFYRFPILLACFTYSIGQTYTMTWESTVPPFFAIIIPMGMLLLAQLGLVSTLFLFVIIMAIETAILGNQLEQRLIVYSMFVVCFGFLAAFRSSHSREIENFIQRQKQLEAEQKLSQIANQVAHDLRAPLAVLEVLSKHHKHNDLEGQSILGDAIARIRDIANDLLAQGRTAKIQPFNTVKLVESVLAETRTAQSLLPGIQFKLEVTHENRQIQARGVESEFKRVLSIILNNAVEALGEVGLITVSITRQGPQVKITVADTGKGIPKELISQIGQKGVSFGKSDGNGLGLHYVITTLKNWGGDFSIESEFGRGTQASLILKIVKT